MKFVNILIYLVSVILLICDCLAKPSKGATIMENEKELDPNFILRWTVIEGTGDIEIEIQANCTGWTGISFAEGQIGQPGSYSDVIMGGFNDELQRGYSEVLKNQIINGIFKFKFTFCFDRTDTLIWKILILLMGICLMIAMIFY